MENLEPPFGSVVISVEKWYLWIDPIILAFSLDVRRADPVVLAGSNLYPSSPLLYGVPLCQLKALWWQTVDATGSSHGPQMIYSSCGFKDVFNLRCQQQNYHQQSVINKMSLALCDGLSPG